MICPYCNGELREGEISCDSRSGVIWRENGKKLSFFDRLAGIGRVTAARNTLFHNHIPAGFCAACRKMIIDTEVWGENGL